MHFPFCCCAQGRSSEQSSLARPGLPQSTHPSLLPPSTSPEPLRSVPGMLVSSLSGVIRKVPLIQKSTIPDSIKFQSNEGGGKKIICLTAVFTGGEAGGSLMDCKTGDGFKGSWAGRQNDDGGIAVATLRCSTAFPPPMAKRQGQGSSPILQSQDLRGRNKLGNITKIQLKVTNDKFPSKRGWDAMPKKSNKNSTRATFLSANGMSQSRCCSLTAPSAGGRLLPSSRTHCSP